MSLVSAKDLKTMNFSEFSETLSEGLNDKQKLMFQTVLNTTHKELVESKFEGNHILTETAAPGSTSTANISKFDKMFAPLIRRVLPALLANELVGVQPQTSSNGIVRTIRNRYATTTETSNGSGTDAVTAGTEADAMALYEKYSKLLRTGAYDSVDALSPYEQTLLLEMDRGKEMDLEVLTQRTETMTRKLSATYTLEAADDLAAYDGLDIESELSYSVGGELLRDIDRELINKLNSLAGYVEAFDFALVDGRYAGEKLAAMSIAIDNLSTEIAMATKKAGATWMLVTPRVFTGLKHASNGAFTPATASGQPEISSSAYVGMFGNIKVYVDYLETGTQSVLMGYKGSSEMETGLIYAPYIPISSTGLVTLPESGDKRMMLRTRYALHSFTDTETSLGDSPDYYARATIANIQLGFKN